MANLIVTFTRGGHAPSQAVGLPVMDLTTCRSEAVEIGAVSEQTDIECADDNDIAHLHAEAACWVAIGDNPVAQAVAASTDSEPTGSFPMDEGQTLQSAIYPGQKVAVVQRS